MTSARRARDANTQCSLRNKMTVATEHSQTRSNKGTPPQRPKIEHGTQTEQQRRAAVPQHHDMTSPCNSILPSQGLFPHMASELCCRRMAGPTPALPAGHSSFLSLLICAIVLLHPCRLCRPAGIKGLVGLCARRQYVSLLPASLPAAPFPSPLPCTILPLRLPVLPRPIFAYVRVACRLSRQNWTLRTP